MSRFITVTVKDTEGNLLLDRGIETYEEPIVIKSLITGLPLAKFQIRGPYDPIDLRWAMLEYANLRTPKIEWGRVMLSGAKLRGAKFPAPSYLLLASWGRLSDASTLALMRLDASAHPDPDAFNRWAEGSGGCPYNDSRFQRVANFSEDSSLWIPGPPPTIWEALTMVMDEKCPGWNGE